MEINQGSHQNSRTHLDHTYRWYQGPGGSRGDNQHPLTLNHAKKMQELAKLRSQVQKVKEQKKFTTLPHQMLNICGCQESSSGSESEEEGDDKRTAHKKQGKWGKMQDGTFEKLPNQPPYDLRARKSSSVKIE